VELLGTLCVLYVLQCLAWLPRGSCVFWGPLFARGVSSGPGLRLLDLLPTSRSQLAFRFPLTERAGSLTGPGRATWSAPDWKDGDSVDLAALRGASADGSLVRVEGRAFARGADARHAERIEALLRAIGEASPSERRAVVEDAFSECLSLSAFSAARGRFDATARLLAWASIAYGLALFVFLPAVAFAFGTEKSLGAFLPVVAILHVATLWCYARADRELRPARRREHFQAALGAAFYPPSLLRAHSQLRSSTLAAFHPAAVAVDLLPRSHARDFLRMEIARTTARLHEPVSPELGFSLVEVEVRALWRLVEEFGEATSLLAPPARIDPLARSYCPACLCEYRRCEGPCSDCAIPLAVWSADVPSENEGRQHGRSR